MTSLFRPEALAHAHAQAKPYGTIILTRGPGQGLLVMLLCLLVVALIVWVASASYTRKAQVTGVLQPSQGVTRVIPMQAGQVVSVQVKEGQTVQAGDVMFVLSSERDTVSSGLAEAHISSLLRERRESLAQGQAQQQVLMAHRIASLGQRAQDLQAERRRIHAQIQLQHRRVALSESTVARQRELHEASFVSAAQVHGAQADLLDQQQRMAELERSLSALDRETASTEAEAQALRIQANLDLDAGRQLVNTAQQALAENEARRQTVIRAPSQGVVSALTVQQGQTVSAGQVLASVLPQ